MANKFDYLVMRNGRRSVNAIVSRQELVAASAIAHEQLSRHQLVRRNLFKREELCELVRVWSPIRQEPNPNGSVGQDHLGPGRCDDRIFAGPRHIFHFQFAPAKTSQAVVSRASDQGFKTQTNRLGVRRCSTCSLRRREEFLVDIQRLLQGLIMPYNLTVHIWQDRPLTSAPASPSCTYTTHMVAHP